MPQVEFVSQSSRNDGDRAANTERLVNLYPEPVPAGGRAGFVLRSVLGAEEFTSFPGVFVRALAAVGDRSDTGAVTESLFAGSGGTLWEIPPDGSTVARGSIPDCPRTTIVGNGGLVTLTCGREYHVWDGSTLSEPTPGAFDEFGSVEFIAGYTVLTEWNGRRFQWSALRDPEDLPGLNFATADGRDDYILRPYAIGGNLWLFKTASIEIWGLTGAASEEAFARLPGGVLETGLFAYQTITRFPGGAFFIGSDGVCYVTTGAELQPVSRTPVEAAIKTSQPTSCFYYEDEGHKFCVVRFRDRPAWVFDLSTGLWHERASGEGSWSATVSAYCYGAWRVGRDDGVIATLERSNRDLGGPLIREATSVPLYLDGSRARMAKLEILAQVGYEYNGSDPSLIVQLSRDGGHTWGREQVRSLGGAGQYDRRMVMRSLGSARQFVAKLRVTDPVDVRLWSSAVLELA